MCEARDSAIMKLTCYIPTVQQNIKIDRYDIKRRLGQGGMGAVFYAVDKQLKRPVALKIIRPDILKKRGILARFKREIKLMAQLNHPSIVEIFDVGNSEGTMYFAMEYLEGETLHSIIKKGTLSPRRAVSIVRQMAEALQAVHELKIYIVTLNQRTSSLPKVIFPNSWTLVSPSKNRKLQQP